MIFFWTRFSPIIWPGRIIRGNRAINVLGNLAVLKEDIAHALFWESRLGKKEPSVLKNQMLLDGLLLKI